LTNCATCHKEIKEKQSYVERRFVPKDKRKKSELIDVRHYSKKCYPGYPMNDHITKITVEGKNKK
jgi:hypothetical protein